MSRIKDMYVSEIAPALMKKFEYKSTMQIPKLDKIVINVGVGDAKENSKAIDSVINDITLIAGQKAVPTYAKKSVAVSSSYQRISHPYCASHADASSAFSDVSKGASSGVR